MTEAPTVSSVVYLIVGMHRSGTSSLGQLMESIGFDFGDNLLEGVDSINDRGFWEDRDVVALDQHIFELYGSSWFDFERLPGKWWEDAKIRDLIGVAETWFQEGFSHEKPIAVKDPRFCRLLPFWKRVFLGMGIRPHIIFVVRHPAEVAASLKRRDGFSLQVGYLLWLAYVIDALYYSRNLDLAIVDYESMLANPQKVVSRLAKADVASVHGLSEAELANLVKSTFDVKSRHQKVSEVLSKGEVQGDVQAMAHELYEVLVKATPDEAKAIADKYRKRFYRLLDHHKEVLSALQATVNKQVEANQKLTEIGSGHSHALAVIHDKDKQLEENKDFIAKCLAEIGNKESQLAITQQELQRHQLRITEQESLNQKNSALWERFEELQQVVHGRELKLSESLAYIEKCEAWIGELNLVSEDCQRILAEQRDYIARCEARIKEQDQWLTENAAYIAKCDERIKEQDFGLAENQDYIQRCEARIREQDNGLQIRDQMLGERLEKINRCEARITEIDQTLAEAQRNIAESRSSMLILEGEFKEKISECDRQLQEQKDLLATNQNYLQQCEEYIAEQDRALEDFGKNMGVAQEQIATYERNLAVQVETLAQLRLELAAAQDKNAQREARIVGLENDLATRIGVLTQVRGVLADTQDQLSQRESRIAGLEHDLSAQVAKLAQARADLANTNNLLDTRSAEIAETSKTLAQKLIELSQARDHIAQLDSKILQQDAALAENREQLHQNTLLLAEQKNLSDRQQKIISEKNSTIETHQQRIRELDDMVSSLQVDKENLETEIVRQQQLDNLSKQRTVMQKKQIDQLKAHAAALESELVALRAQHDSKQQALERYRSYRVVKLIDKFAEAD